MLVVEAAGDAKSADGFGLAHPGNLDRPIHPERRTREVKLSDMGAKAGEQEQGGGIAETVSEQATKAKEKEKGRRDLRDQLDDWTTQLGQQVRSLAETLLRSGVEIGLVVVGAILLFDFGRRR